MKPLVRHFCEVGFGSPDVGDDHLPRQDRRSTRSSAGCSCCPRRASTASPRSRRGGTRRRSSTSSCSGRCCSRSSASAAASARSTCGSPRRWARSSTGSGPGTIRLAPWRDRVPLTGGDSRTVVDVVLYAALVVSLVVAAFGALPTLAGRGRPRRCSSLIGLRDKVIFLAARSEVYGTLAVTYLFVGRRRARRRPAGDGRDLVGRGDLQAQPALPVRGRGDGEQQPDLAREADQAALPPGLPRRPAALAALRVRSRTAARSSSSASRCCSCSATAAPSPRSPRSVMLALPPPHPLEPADGRAAGVERLHDHRDRQPVRRPGRAGRQRPGAPAAGGRC